MKNPRNQGTGGEDTAQLAIDAMQNIDFDALSFVQLKRLESALADAKRRIAVESGRRTESDAQGDTVRVAVPPSLER
ncbi:MAG TPA: hypothetical protein VLB07_13200 [Woeseiaceae bacterium]|nr:hypothetical protein [Woeseiaceae bacterium]